MINTHFVKLLLVEIYSILEPCQILYSYSNRSLQYWCHVCSVVNIKKKNLVNISCIFQLRIRNIMSYVSTSDRKIMELRYRNWRKANAQKEK